MARADHFRCLMGQCCHDFGQGQARGFLQPPGVAAKKCCWLHVQPPHRRAKLQLHLQATVEGLSVVAITYYASQLVQYMAKGVKHAIEPLTPEGITAAAIPVIALIVALGTRRMRKHLDEAEGGH